MVRACQFKIDDTLQPDEIPFCGQATANKIKDIARTGTTEVLEAHRSVWLDERIHHSYKTIDFILQILQKLLHEW